MSYDTNKDNWLKLCRKKHACDAKPSFYFYLSILLFTSGFSQLHKTFTAKETFNRHNDSRLGSVIKLRLRDWNLVIVRVLRWNSLRFVHNYKGLFRKNKQSTVTEHVNHANRVKICSQSLSLLHRFNPEDVIRSAMT